jgi:branched-chain amino acid transport system ATP-binding protein
MVSMTSVDIQGLTVSRGGRPVVRNASINIRPGQITALLGPNGAGKSSLVLAIAGILPSEKGEVLFNGQNLARKRPEVIRAAGISAVPEGHQILTDLTVEENLKAAGSSLTKFELKKAISDALAVFPELESKLQHRGGNLSGGQQQMLALAHALVGKPQFLLADELSLGLAPVIVNRLMEVIVEITKSGVGVLLIEQYTTIALKIAQWVYILDRGMIRFSGLPADVKANPKILHDAYLAGKFEQV